jgi:hypothetical protein
MLAISRALADDQRVTKIILRIKIVAPFAFRRLCSAYIPRDSEINAEEISGHMYGIY